MTSTGIIITVADIIIVIILIRLLFKTFKKFFEGIFYFLLFIIGGIALNGYDKDFDKYSGRVLLLVIIMFILAVIEVAIIY